MAQSTLRRAALASVCALGVAPAAAQAQSPAKPCATPTASTGTSAATAGATSRLVPRISRVRPAKLAIGARLEIRGRYFRAGRCRNTVVFRRSGGKAVFVKADLGTKKLLKVTLPARLEKQLTVRRGFAVPTRFRVRVLSTRFGTRYTSVAGSPVISPLPPPPPPPAPPAPAPIPDIDTDGDGIFNAVDEDDDNDLLSDAQERAINAQQRLSEDTGGLQTLLKDTDGDGVEDGYELRSARDLNDTTFLPYPGKRPYANPLDPADATTDFDGDGLSLGSEQRLWAYESARVGRARSLEELSYSDGTKYSVFTRDPAGRRIPALGAAGYEREQDFRQWAAASGRDQVQLREPGGTVTRSIFDVNRDGAVNSGARAGYPHSESSYYDTDSSGHLDDGERDEDADGLINIDETEVGTQTLKRRLSPGFWAERYAETPFSIVYAGTAFDDPDSDGDTIRDGADDEDFDDVPNIMELSRSMAIGDRDPSDATKDDIPAGRPWFGRVNPFNPCLPDAGSRTCPRYVPDPGWAPFDDSPNYFAFE